MRRRIGLLFLTIVVLFYPINTWAWHDRTTHQDMSLKAIENSVLSPTKGNYLKNLGFSENIEEIFMLNGESKNIKDWIRFGSLKEDAFTYFEFINQTARFFNHFHNPLFPSDQWNQAGLDRDYIVPLPFLTLTHLSGESSLLWAQNETNNEWSWQKVRDYYNLALTSSTDNQREANFAKTFKGLGHIIHLIQDSAQPAHVRNDPHPLDGSGIIKGFESWAKNNAVDLGLYDLPPNFPIVSHDTSVGNYSPITQFWDTDQYDGTNPSAGTNIGISEYTNANFFSEDTINASNFPYPQINQSTPVVEGEFTNTLWNTTYQRQYYLKDCCGETNEGQGYLLSAVDYLDYYRQEYPLLSIGLPIKPILDNNVYADYADLLLPRAIGYSAGLLNYFFRGEIEVIQIPDSNNIKIKNNSSEDMDGIFTLYYEATDGTRNPVSDGSWSRSLQPVNNTGDTSDELSFTEPTNIAEGKEYIIVFEGTLGKESNVVVGKIWECILFELVGQFVGVGGGDGQVSNPNYINTDSSFIYVSDRHNHRVQLFNYQGIFQDKFGSTGAGPGQFLYPEGIDVDDNFIYVADVYGRVQIFNKTSPFSFIAQFGTDVPSPPGPGEFTNISDVKVDSDFIYVADGYGHIQIFYKTSPYAYVATISGPGLTDGLHNYLNYFDIDNNYVYTVNSGNTTKVQIFNKTSPYSFVSKVGSKGSGDGQFLNPQGITVDSKYIYVVDHENRRIVVFDKDSPYSFVTNFAINSGNLIDIEVTPSLIFLLRLYSSNRIYVYTNCP